MRASTSEPSVPGAGLIRLYPRAWQERYGDEFLAVLEAGAASGPAAARLRFDVIRGALDAHLHPAEPSIVPGVAAVFGGGLWVLAAAPIAALPAPPDWPGYLLESVPVAIIAVVVLWIAMVGAWLREDGRSGLRGRRLTALGVVVATLGYLAWAATLIGTLAGIGYGAPVAIASTVAAVGTILIGLALAEAGDWPIAGVLVAAPVLLVAPPSIVATALAWMAYGIAWISVGLVELSTRQGRIGPTARPG